VRFKEGPWIKPIRLRSIETEGHHLKKGGENVLRAAGSTNGIPPELTFIDDRVGM